jgi:NADH-quinone oxidoreductase subunit C
LTDEPTGPGQPPAETGETEDEAARARREALERAQAAKAAAEAAKPPWERDAETPEWSEAEDDPLVAALRERHRTAIERARRFAGDLVLDLTLEGLIPVAESLKQEHGYTLMVDICGADYPERERRFDVVYHLRKANDATLVRLRVTVDEATEVPSLTPVFRGANWLEREVYDMFGVRFADHPDLTRILMWEGFNGYPLRKDFPVEGVDTGSAIYPEFYEDGAGPIDKSGTGWLVKEETEEGEG